MFDALPPRQAFDSLTCSCFIMNKLSLVGMQLPEKYKENFDVSSEGPSSGVTGEGWENYTSFYAKNIKATM